MEQRIVFEDGKLTVHTDNGVIKDGETKTEIRGEFLANANTVAMLLAELEGHSLTMKYIPYFGWMERSGSWSLIAEREIAEELKKTKEACEVAQSNLSNLEQNSAMLKDVLDRIENHNKKWWYFWRRKIDISDIIKLYGTNQINELFY